MDLRSSLGFGFFSRSRTKNRKRSERQLADMYNKVAIRGSIQHVWGDELPHDGHSIGRDERRTPRHAITAAPIPADIATDDKYCTRTTGAVPTRPPYDGVAETDLASTASEHPQERVVLAPPLQSVGPLIPRPGLPSLASQHDDTQILHTSRFGLTAVPETISRNEDNNVAGEKEERGQTLSYPNTWESSSPISPRPTSITSSSTPSVHSLSFDSAPGSGMTVHKKFSFCPSTISLVSPRSASGNLRTLRNSSQSRLNHPYAQSPRSSVLSSSTPSIARGAATTSARNRSDDRVSIADDEENEDDRALHQPIQISPSSSLHYSTSIISRISSTAAEPAPKMMEEHHFLPGQIYAPDLPDALRRIGALPAHFDAPEEDDDNDSSISGLSEVNAGHSSDSDFQSMLDSDDDDDDEMRNNEHYSTSSQVFADRTDLISTGINSQLRRDSIKPLKRLSYTQLESGEYLATVESKRRSNVSTTTFTSALSDRHGNSRDPRDHESQRRTSDASDESHWFVEHEFLASGI